MCCNGLSPVLASLLGRRTWFMATTPCGVGVLGRIARWDASFSHILTAPLHLCVRQCVRVHGAEIFTHACCPALFLVHLPFCSA